MLAAGAWGKHSRMGRASSTHNSAAGGVAVRWHGRRLVFAIDAGTQALRVLGETMVGPPGVAADASPEILGTMAAAGHSPSCFAVVGDGADVVITGGHGGGVIAWNFKSGEQLWKHEGHSEMVTSVVVSEGYVVSGSRDKTVRCLSLETGEERWRHEGHSEMVTSVAVSEGYVVSGSGDKTVRCLSLETGEERWKHEGHSKAVTSVAVSEGYVVSGSYDNTVRCVSLETGEEQTQSVAVQDLGAAVFSVLIVEKHRLAVAGCANGTVGIFHLDDLRPLVTLGDQHPSVVGALATAEDGDTLLSGSTKLVRTDLRFLVGRGTIVVSTELGDYNKDCLKRFARNKPRLDYTVKAAKELVTTAQLASFGFTAASVPEQKELREAMEWVRHLGISTEGLFPPMFAAACVAVVLFAVIAVVQESVEAWKFVRPQSKALKFLWLAMSAYSEAISTVCFVPLCQMLARAGDCTYDRGFGEGSSSAIGEGSDSNTDSGGRMWLDAMVRSRLAHMSLAACACLCI